jgi:hypothetical protein
LPGPQARFSAEETRTKVKAGKETGWGGGNAEFQTRKAPRSAPEVLSRVSPSEFRISMGDIHFSGCYNFFIVFE